jgi:hypothetical protein
MEKIGKYEIKSSAILDGLSIHESVDPADGRAVSIRRAESNPGAAALRREAANLSGLSHPALPQVLEQEDAEGQGAYVVMTSVPVRSLRERLQSGSVAPEAAWRWVQQTASALDYLHSQGVVHRNITPETIRVSESDEIQLTGFSLAARSMSSDAPSVEEFAGGIGYQSPEFLLGDVLSGTSDQFSLAVVAVECLGGKAPFAIAGEVSSIYETIFTGAKLGAMEDRVSASALRVCERALSPNSAQRFGTCGDFAKALEASLSAKAGTETRAISASQMAAELESAQSAQRSRAAAATTAPTQNYTLWVAIAAAVVVILGAVYWFTGSKPEVPSQTTPAAVPGNAFKDAAKSIIAEPVPAEAKAPVKRPPVQKKKATVEAPAPIPAAAPLAAPVNAAPTPPPPAEKPKVIFSEPTTRRKEN